MKRIIELPDKPFSALVLSSGGVHYYSVDLDYYPASKKPWPWRCTCDDMPTCWHNQKAFPGPFQPYVTRTAGINPKRHICKHAWQFMLWRSVGILKKMADDRETEEMGT